MRAAITVLRERFGAQRSICVTHADLPGNDFSALFDTLHADPDSYLRGQPNVFPVAIGRSFFESLLPPAQVSLGWSSYAAQWLSRVPALIPGHFIEMCATEAQREAFIAQAATDWRTFLSLRARELRPSGRLVMLLPAIDAAGRNGTESVFDAANECLGELVACGTIGDVERSRMVIPNRVRGRAELLAPFAETGSFAGLVVEHCDISHGRDTMWDAYRAHGDGRLVATEWARFFRSTFVPTLAVALDPARPPADRPTFANALEAALARRLEREPFEVPQTLATMVLTRQPG